MINYTQYDERDNCVFTVPVHFVKTQHILGSVKKKLRLGSSDASCCKELRGVSSVCFRNECMIAQPHPNEVIPAMSAKDLDPTPPLALQQDSTASVKLIAPKPVL